MIMNILMLMAEEYCKGNPGAIGFLMESLQFEQTEDKHGMAISGFERMKINGITADKLYMLWNDCLNRDTKRAIYIMLHDNIQNIHRHINYGKGRGIPYTENEPKPYRKEEEGEWWIFTFFCDGTEKEGKCVKIKGTYGEARAKMIDKYGTHFAFQYSEKEWERDWNDPNRIYLMSDVIEKIK